MQEQNEREYKKVSDYLLGMISAKEVSAGGRLPSEREIAAELGVSRNSVREAIRMLDNMGVIECRQGSGNFLAANINRSFRKALDIMFLMHETDMADICRFRRSIEKSVFDMAYERRENSPYLARMGEIAAGFESANPERQSSLDKGFHYMLVKMAENRFLETLMDSISDMYQGWIDAVLSDIPEEEKRALFRAHYAIYKSLTEGDYRAGIDAVNTHYEIIDRVLLGREE